jgi:predicted RNA binding protein YcfA (HicA-like mRNA interferase family)
VRRRDVEAALRRHGCTVLREGGRHTIWQCPDGDHLAPVPRHREISAGVVASIANSMRCLGKGWLR